MWEQLELKPKVTLIGLRYQRPLFRVERMVDNRVGRGGFQKVGKHRGSYKIAYILDLG